MDNDSPVTFRIDDANGEAVYTNSDKKTRVENKRIWLKEETTQDRHCQREGR